MEEYEQHTDVINCLAFQGDSLLICALKNGHIFIWNYLRGNLIKKI
jgi:WD40 repeat protein